MSERAGPFVEQIKATLYNAKPREVVELTADVEASVADTIRGTTLKEVMRVLVQQNIFASRGDGMYEKLVPYFGDTEARGIEMELDEVMEENLNDTIDWSSQKDVEKIMQELLYREILGNVDEIGVEKEEETLRHYWNMMAYITHQLAPLIMENMFLLSREMDGPCDFRTVVKLHPHGIEVYNKFETLIDQVASELGTAPDVFQALVSILLDCVCSVFAEYREEQQQGVVRTASGGLLS